MNPCCEKLKAQILEMIDAKINEWYNSHKLIRFEMLELITELKQKVEKI